MRRRFAEPSGVCIIPCRLLPGLFPRCGAERRVRGRRCGAGVGDSPGESMADLTAHWVLGSPDDFRLRLGLGRRVSRDSMTGVRLGARRMTFATSNEPNDIAVVGAREVGMEGGFSCFAASGASEVVISRKGRRLSSSSLNDAAGVALSKTLATTCTGLLDSDCSVLSSGTGTVTFSSRSCSEGWDGSWSTGWARELWRSTGGNAPAEIREATASACEGVEKSGVGNFGDASNSYVAI